MVFINPYYFLLNIGTQITFISFIIYLFILFFIFFILVISLKLALKLTHNINVVQTLHLVQFDALDFKIWIFFGLLGLS